MSRLGVGMVGVLLGCVACAGQAPASDPVPDAAKSAVATPAPTTSAAVRTTTAEPAPVGELVYRADWSVDLDGWTGNEDWAVSGGELLGRGTLFDLTAGIVAPVDVDGLAAYAVEADIKLLRYEISNGSFGVMARIQEDGTGYAAGHDEADGEVVLRVEEGGGRPLLDARPFRPAQEWHRYRIEVRGNELAVSVDGAPVLAETDNIYLTGRVGLWSSGAQLLVRSFEVYRLPGA